MVVVVLERAAKCIGGGSGGQQRWAAKRWLRAAGQRHHWRAEKGRGDILGEEVILAFKPIIVLIILRCTASRPPSISTTLGALDVIPLLSKHAGNGRPDPPHCSAPAPSQPGRPALPRRTAGAGGGSTSDWNHTHNSNPPPPRTGCQIHMHTPHDSWL